MIEVSRTAKSARNVGASVASQLLVILLGFVTRTVFISELGVALLGVNSLLTSVVSMLALADLGINGAIMYALYQPLKSGDTAKTATIVCYATRLYQWIAVVVGGAGIALTPFIHLFVRLETDVHMLEFYYLVLLANTVVGYLMIARVQLIDADQKIYLTKAYSMVFNILRSVAQIVSLVVWGSFLVFLVIQVVFTVANNLVVYVRAGKLYPFLAEPAPILEVSERRSIQTSVRAMMIFRLGGLILNSSPAMLISIIVGTLALGYYSNYMLVVASAVMITEVAFSTLTPSVGNLVAAGDRTATRRVFDEVVLLSILLHGGISVAIVALVDDFIVIWLGSDFVLSRVVVVAVVMSFYVTGTLMPLWSFRSATGLFRKTQYVMLATAVVSIALSFGLGEVFGLAGVVVAPTVARLLTGAWYEPWILLRDHLSGGRKPYFSLQAGALALWVALGFIIVWVGESLGLEGIAALTVKGLIVALSVPTVTWLVFRRLPAFKSVYTRFRSMLPRKSRAKEEIK